jgi:hypothetical protein
VLEVSVEGETYLLHRGCADGWLGGNPPPADDALCISEFLRRAPQ